MRKLFHIILFILVISITHISLLSNRCFSQSNSSENIYHLNNLFPHGILLDKGPNVNTGDNPEWAKTNFIDAGWMYLNIDQSISQLAPLYKKQYLLVTPVVHYQPQFPGHGLALLITQYAASDVYIDGRLLQRFGKISSSKEHIDFNPHNEPVPFRLNTDPVHLIAIRFACNIPSSNRILHLVNTVPLSVRLQSLRSALTDMKAKLINSRTTAGVTIVYAVFGLLFLLLFLFYRRQRLNLFFGLFSLSVVMFLFITTYLNEGQYNLNELFFLKLASNFLDRTAGINIFLFILLALFTGSDPGIGGLSFIY